MASLSLMDDDLFRAAVKGDVDFLSNDAIEIHGVSYYTDQTTPKGNTIVHIAAEYGRAEFLKLAVSQFPDLFQRKNNSMDTPLHIAAMKGYEKIVKLLVSFQGCATMEEANEGHNWPWLAKTKQGDTPLHLALSNNKLNVVMDLLEVGSTLALSLVNAAQQTPLHVFLEYCFGTNRTAGALLEEGVLNLQGEYKSKGGHTNTQSSSSMLANNVLTEMLKYKPATCMADSDGLTPLLIATQRGCVQAIKLILDYCPQSAEVTDPHDQTMLHLLRRHHDRIQDCGKPKTDTVASSSISYWDLKELLKIPEIDAVKDVKDSLGNTPAHVAIANQDFVLVRVLFECFADFTIKNRDGVSAIDLIQSCPEFPTKMEEVVVREKVFNNLLDEKLVQAVEKGTLFQEIAEVDIEGEVIYDADHACCQGRTEGGLSILHLAVRHGQEILVEELTKLYPRLVLTADSSGDTPLHLGARLQKDHHPVAATLLQLTKNVVDKFRNETGPLFLEAFPWQQKNSRGDTPLHEALRSSNYDLAVKLLDIDSGLSLFQNREGETPLHILARHGTYTKSDKIRALVERLVGRNDNVVHKRDAQGFTPLLRAAHCRRIRVAYWIVHNCP